MTKLVGGIRPYFHVVMIGIFHLISGSFEIWCSAIDQYGIKYPLLNMYNNYSIVIGLITIIIAFFLFLKTNLARILAIFLAWWNLFSAPALWIVWHIYVDKISIESFSEWLIYTTVLILLMTLIRIYIIRILSISRAGCLFIKKPPSPTS